jgi:hypothetical protein
MEYARLETASLKDVTDDYYYGCSCRSCLHTARLSLSKLRLGEYIACRTHRDNAPPFVRRALARHRREGVMRHLRCPARYFAPQISQILLAQEVLGGILGLGIMLALP